MAETEGGDGELVQNGRIDFLVVIATETVLEREKSKFLHLFATDEGWKEFVVDDVLPLCDHDAPSLLIEPLVAPVRIQSGQLRRNAIVLAEKDRLRDGHVGRAIHSIVACIQFPRLAKFELVPASYFCCLTCSEALDIEWWVDIGLGRGAVDSGFVVTGHQLLLVVVTLLRARGCFQAAFIECPQNERRRIVRAIHGRQIQEVGVDVRLG